MDLTPHILAVMAQHPEFSPEELEVLCEDFLSKYNKKTKEATKHKALGKWLAKEFELEEVIAIGNEGEGISDRQEAARAKNTDYTLAGVPRHFFAGNKNTFGGPVVTIKGLDKALGKTVLFDGADAKIKAGAKVALVGKNGAGKSTLLKMLIGREAIDDGEMMLAKGVKTGYLSQDLLWDKMERSVEEEMRTALPEVTERMMRLDELNGLLEAKPEQYAQWADEQQELTEWMVQHDGYQRYQWQTTILRYFGFSDAQLQLPIKQLSGGEQTKLQIAKFLLQDVDLLILDEPTNHLDIAGIVFLEQFCARWAKTLIVISHDKRFLNTVCDQTLEISQLQLFWYQGNYDAYLSQKAQRYELQTQRYTTQQKYLKQQERFIERFRYKASKASAVQSRIKMLDRLERVELPQDDTSVTDVVLKLQGRLPTMIAELHELMVGYIGNEPLINCPSRLEVTKEMRIGIVGANGVGKTTLLRTILGELAPLYGHVELSDKVVVGSYAQVAHELDREATVLEELVGPGVGQKQVRGLLGNLLISGDKVEQRIGTLSGGERAKVALTKLLLTQPQVVIMDEPTNHLDIPSKDAIKRMLQQFGGVSIIVSHDRDFLSDVVNTLWVMHERQLEVFVDVERGFGEVEHMLL